MIPRQGRLQTRQTAAVKIEYLAYSFPGPSLGWVSDRNLAMAHPGAAFVLENILPTATGGILRRGSALHADPEDGAVRSMFSYTTAGQRQLFACTDDGIWDVTAAGSPSSEYTSLTNGNVITAQYTTTDGVSVVRGVNGDDTPFVYDGSSFSTSPALTFAAPDDANTPDILDFTWVHRNRFWFIEKGSMNAWYLPVGQIGGELVKFSPGGEFKLGGRLIWGGSWSLETGGGLNTFAAFVTSEGEVAVYQGGNPGDVNDWGLVGTYFIGRPFGPRSFGVRGGDILAATDLGLIPLSGALRKEPEAVALTAISAPIEDDWRVFARQRVGDWPVVIWSAGQLLAIPLPTGLNQQPVWLVANLRTNRWAKWTGWDSICAHVHGSDLYFGRENGRVVQAGVGGSDEGAPYVGVYVPVYDQMQAPGQKVVAMVRPVSRSTVPVDIQTSVHADFALNLPSPPNAPSVPALSIWGAGVWGEATWASEDLLPTPQQRWRNQFGAGEAVTVAHQVTSAQDVPLDVEFIRTDVTFTMGELQS